METRKTFSTQDSSTDQPQETRVDCVYYPASISHALYFAHLEWHPWQLSVVIVSEVLWWPHCLYFLLLLVTLAVPQIKIQEWEDTYHISAGHQSTSQRCCAGYTPASSGVCPPCVNHIQEWWLWKQSLIERAVFRAGQSSAFRNSFICSLNIYWAHIYVKQ